MHVHVHGRFPAALHRCAGTPPSISPHGATRRPNSSNGRVAVFPFSRQITAWGWLALRDIAESQPVVNSAPALAGAHSTGVQRLDAQSHAFMIGFRCRCRDGKSALRMVFHGPNEERRAGGASPLCQAGTAAEAEIGTCLPWERGADPS